MICMFRTRMGAWVPGRAVPWSLGRLPCAPGAHSRSSQGGVPGPKLQGSTRINSDHFILSTLRTRIKIYVDFDVDLGSFGGALLESFWASLAAKLGRVER